MPKLITVTEMIRSFSDIVGRVYYQGEIFDIKKGANIVARLSPTRSRSTISVSELNKFFKSAPDLSYEDREDFKEALTLARAIKDDSEVGRWE